MVKKRSKIEIVSDMLSTIQNQGGRMKPTHLMYKANLSHEQLKSYLEELLSKELIQEVKSEKDNLYIIITENGDKLVQRLREMKQFEKSFGF